MNLGLIREHISKSLVKNEVDKVKKFLTEIKVEKGILEEMYIYGLIESLSPNPNLNFMVKECIDTLNVYEHRGNKIKTLFKEYHNPEYVISESNGKLYNAISTLIDNKYKKQPSKKVFESYAYIMEFVNQKNNVHNEQEDVITESIDTDYKTLFKYIKKNVNESFKHLKESEINVVSILLKGTKDDKLSLFEDIKVRSLDMLENISEDDMDLDMKEKSISKIKSMDNSSEEKLEENILMLVDLLE